MLCHWFTINLLSLFFESAITSLPVFVLYYYFATAFLICYCFATAFHCSAIALFECAIALLLYFFVLLLLHYASFTLQSLCFNFYQLISNFIIGGTNKSQFVVNALCGETIHCNRFKTCIMDFLPKSYNNTVADSMFAQIANTLTSKDVFNHLYV